MNSVVTFYSYKGGVGRSMALANLAVLLAKRGKRVLAVDWDLEAPGLERYFSYFSQKPRPGGLLPLFTGAMEALQSGKTHPCWRDHVWEVVLDERSTLSLIPSGRDNHADYAKLLENFDWTDFFQAGGGKFIEGLRDQWREDYDIVLIDSRTGMSDSGGICTIQLPDVLVAMFTANEQSMNGVRDIIDAAQHGRQRLAYDRMPLTILPVLCRFASGTEVQESGKWLEILVSKFEGVCDDWRPPWVPLRAMFERLKIPQIDFYGFGERLAVIEQGTSDPTGMGYSFDRIADLLDSDFKDLEGALGALGRKPKEWAEPQRKRPQERAAEVSLARNVLVQAPGASGPSRTVEKEDYQYDVFISYRRGGVVDDWVRRFVDDLGKWLHAVMRHPPRIYFDLTGVTGGSDFGTAIENALLRSKILVAVLTPAYFTSPHCGREWRTFEAREKGDSPLILPILLQEQPDGLPAVLASRLYLKAPNDSLVSLIKNTHDVGYAEFLRRAADAIAAAVPKAPEYDPQASVAPERALLDEPAELLA